MGKPTSAQPSWAGMLDAMQQSLARILTGLEERERSYNFAAVTTIPSNRPTFDGVLDRRLGQAVTPAEDQAASMDNVLQTTQDELKLWLEMADTVRQTLANRAPTAVS